MACEVMDISSFKASRWKSVGFVSELTVCQSTFWVEIRWTSAGAEDYDHWLDNWIVEVWKPGVAGGTGEGYPPSGTRILRDDDVPWNVLEDANCASSSKVGAFEIDASGWEPGAYELRAWVRRDAGTAPHIWEGSEACTINVIKVKLLVNSTEDETDDYVAKEKTGGERTIPDNTPAGATDNHIPMLIRLEGPSGFSTDVPLRVLWYIGRIRICKIDGSPYPSGGMSVTVGTDQEVHIYGTYPSDWLNDVMIEATTTDSGSYAVCGQEDLTVIWVDGSNMSFRGSGEQGQALTSCSDAKFTNYQSWRYDKVGKFIYHKPTGSNYDFARYQMELKCQIWPDEVIDDVEWDIKREVSGVFWGPGSGSLSPTYKGETDWAPDDTVNTDEDLEQNTGCTEIFSIDGPGRNYLPYTSGYRYTQKGKFREWVEVKIGTKWYVCSPYKEWRMIMHVKFQDATSGWVEDTSTTNEIVLGTISGFAGTWSE
jgi:hypothetical protein